MTDLHTAILTEHARRRLKRRGIREEDIRAILAAASESQLVRPGRVVVQQVQTRAPSKKPFLVRIFVDIDRSPRKL